ncbi:MAG: thiolase family protein [Petrotogales bacterium]
MDIVITSAARTPVGSFQGALSSFSATKLGSIVIKEVVKRSGIRVEDVDQVIMGNVLSAGLGQAPARQACVYAGLPTSTRCMTVNKVCGSGLKSVMLAANEIKLGESKIIIAGGQESMTNAPYILPKARSGYRMGDGKIIDSMIYDGLWDVYNNFHMGHVGDFTSKKYNFSRERLDEYASESYRRAQKAQEEGKFKEEMISIAIPRKKKEPVIVDEDEEPKKVRFEKIPNLKPVFGKEGVTTAANASTINDGAAAVVVMSEETANKNNCKILAKIVAYDEVSQDPLEFTTAPVEAIKNVLDKTNLIIEEIDLFEINEAFSCVPLYAIDQLGLDHAKVNVNGGAVALGHPIGATGTKILVTLIHALRDRGAKRGLTTLCIGGGEAVAMIVETI